MTPAATIASPAGASLDLSKWRKIPFILIVAGGLLALIGAFVDTKQFAYSYLLAFMFYLSLCLGGLFLVLLHHLFDASWSVPIRRIEEHFGGLLPIMTALFLPVALLAKTIYPWMTADPNTDHALRSKLPLFTVPMFYVVAALCFAVWALLSNRLRYWSLKQDVTGAAECTHKLRFYAAWGIFAFAVTLTLGAIMWMKALQHQWFSTMYGVYYFAGSVWTTLPTIFLIALVLRRSEPFRTLLTPTLFYYLGTLMFAFTVFYAYIHFSQYFIIWNANVPEETFWYVLREKGSWWDIGMVIVFGHFLVPFLALLRIDFKLKLSVMIPLCLWAWLMHFCDLSFNIMPTPHPDGFVLHWLDLACMAFIGGVLAKVFLAMFAKHPPYPLRDPRLKEALTSYEIPPDEATEH